MQSAGIQCLVQRGRMVAELTALKAVAAERPCFEVDDVELAPAPFTEERAQGVHHFVVGEGVAFIADGEHITRQLYGFRIHEPAFQHGAHGLVRFLRGGAERPVGFDDDRTHDLSAEKRSRPRRHW